MKALVGNLITASPEDELSPLIMKKDNMSRQNVGRDYASVLHASDPSMPECS